MVLTRNLLDVALCLVSNSGSIGLGRLSCGGRLGGSILGASVGLCVGEKWTGVGILCCRHISENVYDLLLVRVDCMKVWNRTVCWSLW